jgi:hypothetical protein
MNSIKKKIKGKIRGSCSMMNDTEGQLEITTFWHNS